MTKPNRKVDESAVGLRTYVRHRRQAASLYLKERWGLVYQPSTLAKLACTGGGPKFEKAGRYPYYPQHALDEWAEALISPLKSSTSHQVNPALEAVAT